MIKTSSRFFFRLTPSDRILLLVISAVCCLELLFAERIFINNGLGWDGVFYASWVRAFPEVLYNTLDPYYLTRIFPAAMVNMLMRIFKIHLDNHHIIITWSVYNSILIIYNCFIWTQISSFFSMNKMAKIIGFCCLYFNCSTLKLNFYIPVCTDVTACALSISLFYFYLRNFNIPLLLTLLIGSITWPSFLITGLILFLFPYTSWNSGDPVENKKWIVFLCKIPFSFVVKFLSISFVVIGVAYLYFGNHYIAWMFPAVMSDYSPIAGNLVIITSAIIILYLFFAFHFLWKNDTICEYFSFFPLRYFIIRLSVAILLFLAVHFFIAHFSLPGSFITVSNKRFIASIFAFGLIAPFIHIISLALFWGPTVLLFIIYFPIVCNRLNYNGGIGLVLYLSIGIVMSIAGEPRWFTQFYPILVTYLILSMPPLSKKNSTFLVALLLVFSKVWYPFNQGSPAEWTSAIQFPAQHLFMNSGPWMSHQMCLVQGILFVFVFILFLIQKKRIALS